MYQLPFRRQAWIRLIFPAAAVVAAAELLLLPRGKVTQDN
jgi:hypothetical protein